MALKPLISCGLAAAPLLLLALGCGSQEVTRARVPKAAGAPAPAPTMGMSMGTGDVPMPPTPTGAEALAWTLPKGWTETRPGGMRVATLVPPVSGVDISVTALPGPAGGELANVNRWRGQIGLEPVDDAGLARLRTAVKAPAGALSVYDFTSDGATATRMVVALFTAKTGSTWFIKMTGEAKAVGQVRPDFLRLLETLRLG